LKQVNYDVLLITTLNHHETIIQVTADLGVAAGKIRFL
jgi:hypothetical protein